MARKKDSAISAEPIDTLLEGQDPASVLRLDGPLADLKNALAERTPNADMDVHLDSEVEQAAEFREQLT